MCVALAEPGQAVRYVPLGDDGEPLDEIAAAWEEIKHPRGRGGRFAPVPGGGPLRVPSAYRGVKDPGGRWITDAVRELDNDTPGKRTVYYRKNFVDITKRSGYRVTLHPGTDRQEIYHYQRAEDAAEALRRGARVDPGAGPEPPKREPLPTAADNAARVAKFAATTTRIMPRLAGGGREAWNGTVETFPQDQRPGIAGVLTWQGTMLLEESVAAVLAGALDHPDRQVDNPDPFDVVLHELFHGLIGGRQLAGVRALNRLPGDDKFALWAFARLDLDGPSGGDQPIYHTLAAINKRWPGIGQARIDGLAARGLLERSSSTESTSNPETGESTLYVHSWRLAPKVAAWRPASHGESYASHSKAYQDPAVSQIEEGSNELGTILHAAEFFDKAGIGGTPTGMAGTGVNPDWITRRDALIGDMGKAREALTAEKAGPHDQQVWQQAINRLSVAMEQLARDDPSGLTDTQMDMAHLGSPAGQQAAKAIMKGRDDLLVTPTSRRLTLAEYAARLATPDRIANDEAWRHYGTYTAQALAWVQAVAKAEGKRNVAKEGTAGWKRVGALSDQVNQEGPGGKIPAMARQVTALYGDPDLVSGADRRNVEETIRTYWRKGAEVAFHAARATVEGKTVSPSPRRRAGIPITFKGAAGMVSGPLTAEGRRAAQLADWAWKDPAGRAGQAVARLGRLARQAGTDAARREVGDYARMVARLLGTLTAAADTAAAAGWEEGRHPRDRKGRFAHVPGRDEALRNLIRHDRPVGLLPPLPQPSVRASGQLTQAEPMSRDGWMSPQGSELYQRDLRVGGADAYQFEPGGAISDLDHAIGKYTLTRRSVAYRGIADNGLGLKPGAVIHDDGYTAVSADKAKARWFAQMRVGGDQYQGVQWGTPVGGTPVVVALILPEGANAMPGDISVSEFVLPRGGDYAITGRLPDGTLVADWQPPATPPGPPARRTAAAAREPPKVTRGLAERMAGAPDEITVTWPARAAAFDEAKHPRDRRGRFGHGGGAPSIADLMRAAPGTRTPLPASLIAAVNGPYGGLRAEVTEARSWLTGDTVKITGKIKAPDGTEVGDFTRRILTVPVEGASSGSRLVAENHNMEIDGHHQGQGFATAFNRHMEGLYRQAGIREVRLTANEDVGGFAWARTGFDWATRSAAELIGDRFRALLIAAKAVRAGTAERPSHVSAVGRAVVMLADDPAALAQAEDLTARLKSEPFGSARYPTPFEFSNVGWRASLLTWPGRDMMLGSGWDGVKHL